MADAFAGQLARLTKRRTAPLILELDLTEGLAEGPPAGPVSAILTMRQPRLSDVLDGLRHAKTDPRVRALIVRVGGNAIGLGRVQELRDAVADFRESGKAAVAWTESFGEFVQGNVPYYLATAFERIYLQPTGTLGLTGAAVEQIFLRDALAKAGVDFQSGKRQEYKSAADRFTETGFTGPAREAATRMAESVSEQLADAIAASRGKTVSAARELLGRGPFLARQALADGLVDALAYRDEVYEQVRKEAGNDAALLYLQRYQRSHTIAELPRRLREQVRQERFVALIHVQGTIRHGRSGRNTVGSDTVSAALRAAGADDKAGAVVLRVNSPGGSANASDVIWREVVRVRAAGKPVVVSMGDVAASGGYFISAPADAIVAQPGTITGSIGVIMGKPVLRELFGRSGVSVDSVAENPNALMFSPSRPFSEPEWSRINEWLDAIYDDFKEKVATGRRLSPARVSELARGRVWSGADAVANGLADETGGLRDAIALAQRRGGLSAEAPVRLYPRLGPLDQFRPAESSESRPAAARSADPVGAVAGAAVDAVAGAAVGAAASPLLAAFAEGWGPAWQFAAQAGLPPHGPLMLPALWRIS